MDFNPRAPCGARLRYKTTRSLLDKISIHAPRAGRDVNVNRTQTIITDFNPRAPCGARHAVRQILQVQSAISIHAPRAGRDLSRSCKGVFA